MGKIKRYFQGVWKQAKMVKWPTRKELFTAVGIVLVVVTICAVALTISDGIVSKLLQTLDGQFAKASETSEAAMRFIKTLF